MFPNKKPASNSDTESDWLSALLGRHGGNLPRRDGVPMASNKKWQLFMVLQMVIQWDLNMVIFGLASPKRNYSLMFHSYIRII